MMRALVLLCVCGGCDFIFRLDHVASTTVDGNDNGVDDAGPDGGVGGDATSGSDAVNADAPDAVVAAMPQIQFDGYASSTICEGESLTTGLRLTASPSSPITVTVSSENTNYLAIGPPQMFTFDASNWNVPQTVTAHGVMATGSFMTVTVAAPGLDTKLDGFYVRAASTGCV